MREPEGPPEPWRSFFDELDPLVGESVALHCLGGFVLIHAYGVARTTNDVDYVSLIPDPLRQKLSELGGKGSALHERHKVYLDAVTVSIPPDGYEGRLIPLFPGAWTNVSLFALEAHDLALAKLARNSDRDRDDIQRLARAGHLNQETLRDRYLEELRPNLPRETWHDQTLQLWLESYWPEFRTVLTNRGTTSAVARRTCSVPVPVPLRRRTTTPSPGTGQSSPSRRRSPHSFGDRPESVRP